MNKFYIAKDKSGELYLFTCYPNKTATMYISSGKNCFCIPKELFPNLTFEDGPVEITLNLVK